MYVYASRIEGFASSVVMVIVIMQVVVRPGSGGSLVSFQLMYDGIMICIAESSLGLQRRPGSASNGYIMQHSWNSVIQTSLCCWQQMSKCCQAYICLTM